MTLADSSYWVVTAITNKNATPKASQFVVLAGNNTGTGSNSAISISQYYSLYGAIYAPNQAITVSNISGGSPAFYGSIVGQSIAVTSVPFHYDTALQMPVATSGNMAFANLHAPATFVTNVQWSALPP
jgi:hypothetical protein